MSGKVLQRLYKWPVPCQTCQENLLAALRQRGINCWRENIFVCARGKKARSLVRRFCDLEHDEKLDMQVLRWSYERAGDG